MPIEVQNDLIVFGMIVALALVFAIMFAASVIVPAEDAAKREPIKEIEFL